MISKLEMTNLYENACSKSRRDPDVTEFRAWMSKLAMFEKRDIGEALIEWSAQSRFLPTAAELLPIASRLRNSRIARAAEPKLFVRWVCESCNVGRCGFVDASDFRSRRCYGVPKGRPYKGGEICGGRMIEMLRETYKHEERAGFPPVGVRGKAAAVADFNDAA